MTNATLNQRKTLLNNLDSTPGGKTLEGKRYFLKKITVCLFSTLKGLKILAITNSLENGEIPEATEKAMEEEGTEAAGANLLED